MPQQMLRPRPIFMLIYAYICFIGMRAPCRAAANAHHAAMAFLFQGKERKTQGIVRRKNIKVVGKTGREEYGRR